MSLVRNDLHKKYKNSSFNDNKESDYKARQEKIKFVNSFKYGKNKNVIKVENIFNIKIGMK